MNEQEHNAGFGPGAGGAGGPIPFRGPTSPQKELPLFENTGPAVGEGPGGCGTPPCLSVPLDVGLCTETPTSTTALMHLSVPSDSWQGKYTVAELAGATAPPLETLPTPPTWLVSMLAGDAHCGCDPVADELGTGLGALAAVPPQLTQPLTGACCPPTAIIGLPGKAADSFEKLPKPPIKCVCPKPVNLTGL